MKQLMTMFLIVCCYFTVLGQANNDNCTNASVIDLPVPADCPSSQILFLDLDGSNLGATPSSPAIRLTDESSGSSLQSPIADVWYTFVATGSRVAITLTSDELIEPSLLLFQADNCNDKLPVALQRGQANSTQLTTVVEPGRQYYLMLGGKDVNAQGAFSLSIATYNDCSTCGKRRGLIEATPSPVNGSYEAGQSVTFCYTPTLWDPGFALEWLHAVELSFGQGWDLGSLQTTAPLPCTTDMGEWNYYDNWEGCNTGASFGPGFAFDARQGLVCGDASPMDGDPGNNFGDGPCQGLEAAPLPLTFCWTVRVRDDFSNEQQRSLNIGVRPLGDGYSGSWMPFDCGGETKSQFLSTAVPTSLSSPTFELVSRPCPNSCNGAIYLEGGNAEAYQLYNDAGVLVFETNTSILDDTLTNLCKGTYELLIQRNNVSQSISLEVPERLLPEAQVAYIAPCNEQGDFQLIGLLSDPTVNANYFWEGPSGFSSTQANNAVTEQGVYTLFVDLEGCDLVPIELDVAHRLPVVESSVTSSSAVFEWSVSPQDTAYEVIVLSGQSGSFVGDRAFELTGLSENETVAIELKALGTGFCAEKTVLANATTLSCSLVPVSSDTTICGGQELELSVDVPDNTVVSWSPSSGLSCNDCPTTVASPQESTTYEVEIIYPDGCAVDQLIQVWVDELPQNVLPETPLTFCPGESLEFCLPAGNDYLWISPIGFMKTGQCLTYPITNERVAGEYLIRVRLPNGCYFYDRLEIELDPDCGNVNSYNSTMSYTMSDQNPASLSNVFPNPASNQFQLQTDGQNVEHILLRSATGRALMEWDTPETSDRFNVSHLTTGLYYLDIALENGQHEQHRLIIHK